LDILPQVFSTVTIPTAVQAEVGLEADWLMRQGVIPEIKPLLAALNQVNFRISEALIQKALQLAGEL